MPESRLLCHSPADARAVVREINSASADRQNRAYVDGAVVVIVYTREEFASDAAHWAFDRGHADDAVIGAPE